MRYLLDETQRGELQARQQYLFDVFRMYFLPGKPEGGFIPLIPIGSSEPNVLFITGHTNRVLHFLETEINKIPEKVIVITSCMGQSFKKFASKKAIYVPDLKQNFCYLRDGKPFGFDFKISDVELDFYNGSGSIMERIRSAYDLLN